MAYSAIVIAAAVLSLIGVLNDLRIGLDPNLLGSDVPTEDFTRNGLGGVPCTFLFGLAIFFLKRNLRVAFGLSFAGSVCGLVWMAYSSLHFSGTVTGFVIYFAGFASSIFALRKSLPSNAGTLK